MRRILNFDSEHSMTDGEEERLEFPHYNEDKLSAQAVTHSLEDVEYMKTSLAKAELEMEKIVEKVALMEANTEEELKLSQTVTNFREHCQSIRKRLEVKRQMASPDTNLDKKINRKSDCFFCFISYAASIAAVLMFAFFFYTMMEGRDIMKINAGYENKALEADEPGIFYNIFSFHTKYEKSAVKEDETRGARHRRSQEGWVKEDKGMGTIYFGENAGKVEENFVNDDEVKHQPMQNLSFSTGDIDDYREHQDADIVEKQYVDGDKLKLEDHKYIEEQKLDTPNIKYDQDMKNKDLILGYNKSVENEITEVKEEATEKNVIKDLVFVREEKMFSEQKEVVDMQSNENKENIFIDMDTSESDVDEKDIKEGEKQYIKEINVNVPGLSLKISEIENQIYEEIGMDELLSVSEIKAEPSIQLKKEDDEHLNESNIEMNEISQFEMLDVINCNKVSREESFDLENKKYHEMKPVFGGNKPKLVTKNFDLFDMDFEEHEDGTEGVIMEELQEVDSRDQEDEDKYYSESEMVVEERSKLKLLNKRNAEMEYYEEEFDMREEEGDIKEVNVKGKEQDRYLSVTNMLLPEVNVVEEDIEGHVVKELEMIWNEKAIKKGYPVDVEYLEKFFDEMIYLKKVRKLDYLEEVDEQLDKSELHTSLEEINKEQFIEVDEPDEDLSFVNTLLIEVEDMDQDIEGQVVKEIKMIWNEKSNPKGNTEEVKYLEKYNDEMVYLEENNEWNDLEGVNEPLGKRKFDTSFKKIDGEEVNKIQLNEPDEDIFLLEVLEQDIWEEDVVY